MTDKEKICEDLERLWANINECLDDLAIARDRNDDGDEQIALRRMESLLVDTKQTCTSILNVMQEEPVSERFAFKAIPRLLEMIEPTDRVKAYIAKLADALEVEGYSTDAKIVRESLKIMNSEKVPMATMDEEPVSEDLETELNKYIKGHFTIDTEQLDRFGIEEKDYMYSMDKSDMLALVEHFTNWQKTKEEPVSEKLEEAANDYDNHCGVLYVEDEDGDYVETLTAIQNAFKAGSNWHKEQMMAKAKGGTVQKDYQIIMDDGTYIDLDPSMSLKPAFNVNEGDKVKVIVIKEEKL